MNKLMFKYLNKAHPKSYVVKTKFGNVPHFDEEGSFTLLDKKNKIISMLCDLFSCDKDYATEIYESWVKTLPIYVRMKGTTNTTILVMEQTGSGSSIFNSSLY